MQAAVLLLTGILDLDSGVGLRVGLVNHLRADLLRQNLHRQIDRRLSIEAATATTF